MTGAQAYPAGPIARQMSVAAASQVHHTGPEKMPLPRPGGALPTGRFRATRQATMEQTMTWIAVGFFGQALFSARFLVQWLSSERLKRSVVPRAFWYFSIAGGVTLLAYAIHRQDPVFILGQAAGVFIYLRNLQLIFRQARESVPGALQGKA